MSFWHADYVLQEMKGKKKKKGKIEKKNNL